MHKISSWSNEVCKEHDIKTEADPFLDRLRNVVKYKACPTSSDERVAQSESCDSHVIVM